jgi:monoamine oxidase
MSRSRLINLFRRAYRISQFSTQTQMPLPEAAGWLDAHLSRRRVLQAGAVLGGTLGLSGLGMGEPVWGDRPHVSGQPVRPGATQSPVLVVGAGVAGLTAAYRLQQAGVPFEIVEASARIGGRLRSVRNPSGLPGTVELGGEFIDTRHTHVRALAQELELELSDLRAADAGLESEVLYFQGQKVSHNAVVEGFAPLAKQITQDVLAMGGVVTYRQHNDHAARLDRLSLAAYLDAAEIDPMINQLVRVAYITEFGRDAEDMSCLNMLYLIGSEVGQWSTYGDSDERWHVVGGNQSIPEALAKRLDGAIALDTALESIRTAPDGRYRVSLRQAGQSIERSYDKVLITLPFSVLRQVELAVDLPPIKQKAIAELGYGTSSKLAVPFKERIWRTHYGSTISVYTDLDFQNTWESARYSLGPSAWVTNLRAGQQGLQLAADSPTAQSKALTANLEQIFPGIAEAQQGRSLRAIWAADPHALGSYSCYRPGQWTAIAGAEIERVGNLWFAGEHCSLDSQGYMNGAVETAEVAARSILQA